MDVNNPVIKVVKDGMTMGSVLAMIISWSLHKSLFLAIIHGFFSWFYVIYYFITNAG